MLAPTVSRRTSLPTTLSFAHDPIGGLTRFGQDFGSNYYLYVGGVEKSLITTDPKVAQHVLQRNHRAYEKSPLQTEQVSRYVGKGLLTNTGASWLRQRRLIQPGFHRQRLEALTQIMQSVIDQEGERLASRLKKAGPQVDMYDEMLNIAFRVVARAIFSEDINEDELVDFGDKITQIQEHVIREVRLPFLRWFFKISGKQARYLKLSQDILNTQRQFINRRKEAKITRDDLLQMLLDSRYEDTGLPMEEQQLIEETGILFVAGHETSANALSWTFYLLAQHPEVLEQVKAELDRICPGRPPSFQELRQLTYLTQVINESMRLYPPAWITDRVALEDDQVGDLEIPKGTIVVPFIYGIHHETQLWDEPEKFRPERFSAEQQKNHPPFSFIPFGGGPRLCIGNSFAMMEMQLLLASWLRRFSFQLAPNQSIRAKALITLRPEPGVHMYLHEN
ncbi:MAG: cytochrome P450 [Bacteroidota bacterium]